MWQHRFIKGSKQSAAKAACMAFVLLIVTSSEISDVQLAQSDEASHSA